MLIEWIGIFATVALGVAGLYLANNYRRRVQVELASARRESYSGLWEITGLAAPTRLRSGGEGVLSSEERDRLYQGLTDWYYSAGNGMLLAKNTRAIYLSAKHNLNCSDELLQPAGVKLLSSFPAQLTREEKRGCLSIRQLSLLRTQMKSDLAVFGRVYSGTLRLHEREFLSYTLQTRSWRWRKPWRYSSQGEPPPELCTG